jgi:small-conductance mechanosensitive channel
MAELETLPEPEAREHFYKVADVSAHVDELNAELESLKAQLSAANQRATLWIDRATVAQGERDTLRDVLALLAPDLKAMAILYAQKGDHTRSQALANICKSVGVL